jgi:PAS domain S-box-containing protein
MQLKNVHSIGTQPMNRTLQVLQESNGLLPALIENLPGGAVFVVDRDLRYLLAEGEALIAAGFKPEDFVGRTIFEVLPPDLVASYEPLYRQALAGEPFEHEHHAHNHTYISRGIPLHSETGKIYAALVVSYDMSGRKHAEESLRESEARLQSIANLVPDLLWDSQPDGSTNWYNQRWMEYTGQTFEQAIGWGWIDAIHPDDREESARRYREAVEQGMPLQQEHRIRRHDGAYRWFVVKVVPLKDESGKVIKMYGAATDIHDRKQVEDALRESEQKYRSLFTTMDQGFCIIEKVETLEGQPSDFRYLTANPAFERHTGIHDVVGKTIRDFVPNAEQHIMDIYDDVVRTGQPQQFEFYISDLDLWIEADVFPAQVPGQIAVLFSNVSDRKQAERVLHESEERQAFLLELSDTLRAQPTEEAITSTSLVLLAERLHLDRAYIATIYTAEDRVIVEPEYRRPDLNPISGVLRPSDFPEGFRQVEEGTFWINNIADDPNLSDLDRQSLAAIDLTAFIVGALRKGEKNLTWALVAASTKPRQWTPIEIALIEETAERTWAAVERARAEAGLRESEEKYRLLFNSINEGYALCELLYDDDERAIDWKILEVNPAFESLTGLTDTAGKSARELNQPINANWLHTFGAVAQTGEAARFEGHIDETEYWYEISVSRIDDNKRHIVVIFSDISDRKRAEAERIRLIEEQAAREEERQRVQSLAELDRAKTLFFSNVSHEFRTPLTLLLAPLQNALKNMDEWERENLNQRPSAHPPIHPSTLKPTLQLAYRNALRLLKLVNTLLDFSRIEAGRIEAVYEPTDLAQFTTDLASVFRSAIEQAGLQLIVDCPPLPEPVYVDREMWEKIVLNLLSNALKFTFEGKITVSLHPNDNNQVMLQIWDTGSGIAAEHLPHLFERFYQVRGVQARTYEGSGIGLALVNELVQLQGGAIAVTSTVGKGTCFTITLPFGTDHLPPEHIQSTRTLTSTALSADAYVQEAERWLSEESGSMGAWESNDPHTLTPSHPHTLTPRVLIVDDNADMRQYLTHILSEYVQVEAVADGASAWAAIQAQPPDLVLSDVMMPRLDGFGLLQTLRADPHTCEIPVILLSARAGDEAIAEGLGWGADDYLIKPFSAQELIARVNAHLQISLLRGEALHTARTALRRKDELLCVVSHELNTPLVSILGWTRLLRANPPNPTRLSTALDTIERSAMMQAKLVQDLLDVSRITAGKLQLNLQPTELKAVIEGAIATVTQLAAEAEIHLAWTETTTAVVMGDRERLQQVICNLLTNAIKFTPAGGRVDVHLSLVTGQPLLAENEQRMAKDKGQRTNDHYAEIRVTDTGIGIKADFLPHVFEQFRQAEGTHSVKGLGLGLAIARHIVELHNSTIQAQSAGEGQGATFIIKLPLLESNY